MNPVVREQNRVLLTVGSMAHNKNKTEHSEQTKTERFSPRQRILSPVADHRTLLSPVAENKTEHYPLNEGDKNQSVHITHYLTMCGV